MWLSTHCLLDARYDAGYEKMNELSSLPSTPRVERQAEEKSLYSQRKTAVLHPQIFL